MRSDKFSQISMMGAAMSVAARFIPNLAHHMELAALQERQFAAMATLGVADASTHRVMRFVVALAQSQIVPNSEMIAAAHQFNLWRLARGEELIPVDIRQWAIMFWGYEARQIFDAEYRRLYGIGISEISKILMSSRQFADDAERIWQQTAEQ